MRQSVSDQNCDLKDVVAEGTNFDYNTFIGFDNTEVQKIPTKELLSLKNAMFSYLNSKTLKKRNANYKLAYVNIVKELKRRKEQIKEKNKEKIEEQRSFSRKFSEKFSLPSLTSEEDKLSFLTANSSNKSIATSVSTEEEIIPHASPFKDILREIDGCFDFLGKKTKFNENSEETQKNVSQAYKNFNFEVPSFLNDNNSKESIFNSKPEMFFGKLFFNIYKQFKLILIFFFRTQIKEVLVKHRQRRLSILR